MSYTASSLCATYEASGALVSVTVANELGDWDGRERLLEKSDLSIFLAMNDIR